MIEAEYSALAQACDRLLRAPDTSLGRVAVPLLHVVNEHSGWLAQYESLFRDTVPAADWRSRHATLDLPRLALRAARSLYRSRSGSMPDLNRFRGTEVLIVSHLANPAQLDTEDDFYFGPLQRLLHERGLSSTLVFVDHGPAQARRVAIPERFASTRFLLPVVVAPRVEASIWRYCLAVRKALRESARMAGDGFDGRIAELAGRHAIDTGTAANLRLHATLSAVCRTLNPRIVITTYEGDACERIIFHAARSANRRPLCVGYQHTRLLQRAHAIRRSIAAAGIDCDPDVILTLGTTSHRLLENSERLRGVRLIPYGTHRYVDGASQGETGIRRDTCLVLPDADDRECAFLFESALACARRLPHVKFVLRPHPAVSAELLCARHSLLQNLPCNVILSTARHLATDLSAARYCLYRGTSAAIQAVLGGVKPFYLARAGELSFDPLFALTQWRETVSSPEEFVVALATTTFNEEEAQSAKRQCERMMSPIRSAALDELLAGEGLAQSTGDIRRAEGRTSVPHLHPVL